MEASDNFNDDDVDYDEAPTFIDMNSAVEVNVSDANPTDDDMMEDDTMVDSNGNTNDPSNDEGNASSSSALPIIDQAKATFTTHTDAIYAITSHYDPATHTLSIASGGGDDRAYIHQIANSNGTQQTDSLLLKHPHSDSISCVAFNSPHVTKDVSGKVQNNLLAVGSYDGSIVLYNASQTTADSTLGDLVQVLEGPSDVEFLTFHPKGGTVLLAGSIADGTIWMYHTPSKSCMQVFVGHEGGVTAGAFTPDGKWVVSVGQDGTCRVWAPKTGDRKSVV